MTKKFSKVFSMALILALVLSALPAFSTSTSALSSGVVISQVYGGGGNAGAPLRNDFVELFNRGTSPVSLTGWTIQYASATGAGNFAANSIATLSGTLAPGQYYLVQFASNGAVGTLLPTPDATGTQNLSGTGAKVALVNTTIGLACNGSTTPCSAAQLAQIIDLVGWGTANFFETAAAPVTTNLTAVSRKINGCTETDNNSSDFTVGAPAPRNTSSPLNLCVVGDAAPTVASTFPADGATNIARATDITVSFSENVNVNPASISISCATSGLHTFSFSGGPTIFTLNPDTDFAANETCTVTIPKTAVTDQDLIDPPDTMQFDFSTGFTTINAQVCGDPATYIHDVQGVGLQSPINGSTNISIEGIVTADYQGTGQFSGYYVQEEDADADANPVSSEGVFVFNTSFPVSVGDKVRVRGNVFEFLSSGGYLTQLTTVNNVQVCSSGNALPAVSTVNLPVTNLTDWEAFEGMLVNIPQTLTVTETFTLARFGEVSLSVNGRLFNPTNIVAPGAPAIAQQDINNRSRILLDDANNQQNIDPTKYPTGGLSASNTLRSGYTVSGLTGVLEQRFGVYRVQPVGAISFTASNPRSAVPDAVGGSVKVASFNVLNYFNGDGLGGGFPTARGANTLIEFNRQRAKTVSAITTMDADIIGLMEIENDAPGNSAIEDLVSGLNAATASGTYGFINTGVVGTDEIRVALIYKTATVMPYGAYKILDSSANPIFLDTKNRPSLAQTFTQNSNGARVTVVVNHLKSKGSDCNDVGDPDTGDGQGNCNITRSNAATALVNWLAADPTGAGDPDYLIIGDLNSYAMEDPITAIKNAGYTNLLNSITGAYSYVFNGQSGYLDHALASSALTPQVSGVIEWHINADESIGLDYNVEFKSPNQINTFYAADPFRSSDHDPVIVGLNLNDPPTVSAGGPYSVAEGGSVVVSATGSDPNPYDTLTYAWDLDNNGSFETSGQSPTFNVGSLDGPNSYIIKVRATDTGGLFAINTATVDVANVAPTATFGTPGSVNEGSSFGISLASAFDPSAADTTAGFTYAFDCGTGYSALGSSNGATCSAVDNPGVTVKGKIQDKDGGVTEYTASVVINNVAPSVTAAFASASLSCGSNNATLNISFTDSGTVDTHSAVIDWGDGNTQTVSSAISPFSLTHTYAVVGTYNATVSVTDDDGGVGTASASATVGYNTSGFLQPINTDGTSVFKYNSTIPVKISFTACDGSTPANLAPTISLTMISGATPGLPINEPLSTSAADTTGVMRFSMNQYIYNLATRPLPDSSGTYLITVTIPSTGQTFTVQFGLRP